MKNGDFFKVLSLLSLAVLLLAGCGVNIITGGRDFLTGETYPDADIYRIGGFVYTAEEVQQVEVYWRSGEVEIVESESGELKVSESGVLPEDSAMHWLLEEGTLRIRFCGSGAQVATEPGDKHLTLEVPKGIALSIHGTAAVIRAEQLEQESILVSSHSGSIKLGTVRAETVDLSSSAGAIEAESVAARSLTCAASSGSVRMGDTAADEVKMKTSSGSIRLELTAAAQADISTSSGKVMLSLPQGGAEVTYASGSGSLHTDAAYERRGDLYVFGAGESRIAVESSSGSLKITA